MDGKKRSWCTFLTSAEKQKWDLRAFTASVVGRLLQLSVLHLPRQPEATRDRCAAQQGVGLVCITGVTFVSSVRVTHVLMLLVCGGKKGTNKQSEKKKYIFFPVRLIQVRHKFSEKEAGGGGGAGRNLKKKTPSMDSIVLLSHPHGTSAEQLSPFLKSAADAQLGGAGLFPLPPQSGGRVVFWRQGEDARRRYRHWAVSKRDESICRAGWGAFPGWGRERLCLF